jgi:hypothetical protein
LAERQNTRIETGATQPGEHPVSIGPEQQGDTTVGEERHLDDDMLKTLEAVLNGLPASHINGNPALARIALKHDKGDGRSFFDSSTNALSIVVPYDKESWVYLNFSKWPLGDLATTLKGGGAKRESLTRDVVGTGSNRNKLKMLPQKFVDWMLRHETGHAVDESIGWFAGKHYRDPACGAWDQHNTGIIEPTIISAVGLRDALENLNATFEPHM